MLTIRPAAAADMDAVAAIYGHSVTTHYASFEVEPPDAAEMKARFETLVNDNFPYLVTERDGAVLGYAYASRFRPRPAYGHTVEGTVYIHPDHHGRGIGKKLVSSLVDACIDRHFRQMMAVIACKPDDDLSQIASVQLHKSLGFEQVGRFKEVGHKQGLWLDTVILQRTL